jgi:hypothetical protein
MDVRSSLFFSGQRVVPVTESRCSPNRLYGSRVGSPFKNVVGWPMKEGYSLRVDV